VVLRLIFELRCCSRRSAHMQKGQQQDSMPGMDMRANGDMDMSSMVRAWRPWAGHVYTRYGQSKPAT